MDYGKRLFSGLVAAGLLLSMGSLETAIAQTAPPLGTSQAFAVLGGSTVTNTGQTVLKGDLGVSPGSAITGFPPGVVTGTIHAADAVAAQAQADAATAYGYLASEPCGTDLSGKDLGGLTLLPGVYCFGSSAQLTGILTLNAEGNSGAVFVFEIGSTLTTSTNSAVVMNGGSPCNVFFQVGSSATLGTGTQFSGSIFAQASITTTTGAAVTGGSYALTGAVTLDDNADTSCAGTIQVCKVAGSGVAAGTDFQFKVAGSPITIPAGPAPGGSCGPALGVAAGQALISETIPPGTALAEVSTLPSPGLLISSNLAGGTATVSVNPGGQTVATFIDTVPPIIPTTGFLQICKVAGAGVTVGTNFTFSVAGTPVTVPAGPAPGGSCSPAVQLPAGQALIAETLPTGTMLTAVSTLPSAGLLVSSNLAAGTATVTINAGGQTIATFTDAVSPTTGLIQICKVAGTGIADGTNFTFSVAGTPVTVPAGPGPMGSCSTPLEVPAGPINITETLSGATVLTSVSTLPIGLLVSSNLAAGTATVTVNPGGETMVVFLNTLIPPPPTGFLQICKVAGAGVTVGTNFTFSVAGTPVTVPAGAAPGGSCSVPLVVPAGPAIITETLPTGTVLTSVSTLPSGSLVSSNLAAGTATVTVDAGGQTIATFLDTVPPIIPTTGFLQICKVAGAGVTVGTNFTFSVAGTPVTVPAGPAPGGSCSVPLVVPALPTIITETLPAGTALTSVSTLPSGSLVSSNLAAGTATVTVNAGGQTIATFLDTVPPIIPTTGFLQICKVAGAGVTVGTNFTFSVAGTPVTVPAGPAPGGSCSVPLVAPVGASVITETLPAGTALTSVSTLPSGLLVSSNLAAGTATVTVSAGGQTIVTFLNTVIPASPTGFLQICKVAGSGVTAGTNFTFSVAGTTITVPAGSAPGGSCSQSLQLPVGQATVTEVAQAGVALSGVSASPGGRLVASNLAGGTAAVTIVAGDVSTQSILTFTNQAAVGTLTICKVAGPGVTAGTQFTFTVGSNTVFVPAGSCSSAGSFPVGTQLTATETIPSGYQVTAIGVVPMSQIVGAPNLATGSVTFTIGVGGTEVDFTNLMVVATGQLKVCKIAGTGVAPGGIFNFVVAGSSVTIPAGSCVTAATSFPVGASITVAETPSVGTTVSAINVLPAGRQGTVNLSGGTVTATIGTGVTEVDFTNSAGGFGLLKVCKIAGTGVASGANFNFVMSGATFSVPAGFCVKQGLLLVGTVVTINELFSPGTVASAISVLPASQQGVVDLPGQTVTATIGVGVTEVYFTNVAVAP
jgi:hypothetical protein